MRRAFPFVVLAVSLALAACSELSAPRPKQDGCASGYVLSGGECVPVKGDSL